MRRRVLIAVAACFYYSGLVALARWWMRRSGPHALCLIYHRAMGGDLRRHMLYLRRHYRMVHLEVALEELSMPQKNRSGDRRTPLVMTFDDGYRDNYTHAFPLAQELQVPFTIYLVPGYIESGKPFWWLEGRRLVQQAQVSELTLDEQTYRLDIPEDRRALSTRIDHQLRYAPSVAQRDAFLETIQAQLQVPATVPAQDEPALPLTWAQVHEMEQSGYVSYGAHTMHHPVLSALTDPTEIQFEVSECRRVLETQLGHPVHSLAYPIGQQQHISRDVVQAVHQAGYRWALTSHYGINTPREDPFLLQRIEADVDQHWLVVAAEAAGLWGIFSRLRWLPFIRRYLNKTRSKNV